jgi:hypothetical protein
MLTKLSQISPSRALSAVVCLAFMTLVSPMAIAQNTPAPQWMVVTSEVEPVRCGDQEIYYTIAEFKRGTIVAVDGTSGDYSKVRYPASMGVLVPAKDARGVKAGSHVQLINASQLKAESMLRGIDGSWCPVFAEPLNTGIELSVLETIRDGNNEILGYRVAPPRPPVVKAFPYAFVRTSALREATPEEIASHQGGKQITTGRSPLAAGSGAVDSEPVEEVVDEVTEAANEISSEQESADEPVIDLREDQVIPESSNESMSESDQKDDEPVEIQNAIPEVRENPRVISPEKTTRPATSRLTVSGLEALEASFTNARSMPREQLDEALPELLAEFTRARDAADVDDPSIGPLEQRIEWINIRIETRDQRRAIAQALAVADSQQIELNQKIELWNDSRVYNMVGRLMLSGVYTGEHLPLLYRIRVPDPITGVDRTVGYIAPKPDQDLRRFLGSVVGVIGDPVHDDALALTVLSPTKVVLMPGQ